jgi:hypothetical protein
MLRPILGLIELLVAAPAACWDDSLAATSLASVSQITVTGVTHCTRTNGTAYLFWDYFAYHTYYTITHTQCFFVFPLPPQSEARPTEASLCYYQTGVTGRMPVWVSILRDTSLVPDSLYNAIVNGLAVSTNNLPGSNGLYRRRLTQAGVDSIDAHRAQGWIALALVCPPLGTADSERINISNSPSQPWLEVSWVTGVEEQPVALPADRFVIAPNPAPSRAAVHLLADLGPQAEVVIVDAAGRVLRRLASGETAITGLRPGVYVVRVAGSSPPLARKLVITQ